jgi:hypothetical protein
MGYYDNVDVEVPDGYIYIGCMKLMIKMEPLKLNLEGVPLLGLLRDR